MPEKSLLYSLRERKVFRSAGYYVLAAWLVLQVGDVVVEPLGLPAWSMTALLYLLILGFPIAVFLGWRYDITEHGIVRSAGDGDYDPELLRLRPADYLIVTLLLGVLGFAVYSTLPTAQEQAGGTPVAEDVSSASVREGSIAVLPFADLMFRGRPLWAALSCP